MKKLKRISKTKQKLFDTIIYSIYTMRKMYYKLAFEIDKNTTKNSYKDILNTQKYKGENKGQWGYYLSCNIARLLYIIDQLKIKSILDLGSGPGLILKAIQLSNANIRIRGYEIEDTFIKDSELFELPINVIVKKDILTLKKEDISNYECLFFYEPFYNDNLAKTFVENLSKIVTKDQYIIYNPHGKIGKYLQQDKKFKKIIEEEWSPYIVYKITN